MCVRCMVAFALALVMAAGGLPAQGIAYALDNSEGTVPTTVEPSGNTKGLNEDNLPTTKQPALALEHEEEILLVQQEKPEAVAYVTKDGVYTAFNDINTALLAWSGNSAESPFTGDVRLTLLKDLKDPDATAYAPIRFTTSGRKTLDLNGHTAIFKAIDNYVGSALICIGEHTEDTPSSTPNVDLVVDDTGSTPGALVCNNVDTVIKVCGYNHGSPNDYSSSLELHGARLAVAGKTRSSYLAMGPIPTHIGPDSRLLAVS